MQMIYMGDHYVPKEFDIKVEGIPPTGKAALEMHQYIKSLRTDKGTFQMQVEHKGEGVISTIKFKKI